MPIPLGILAATAAGTIPTFEHISTTTLGTAATSITISSIPQTFRHLHLRVLHKNSGTTVGEDYRIFIRVNSDATSGRYGYQRYSALADGGSPVYNADVTGEVATEIGRSVRSGTGPPSFVNKWATTTIDIYDYTSTAKMTTFKSISGFRAGATQPDQQMNLYTGYYNQLAAVSALTILTTTNNLVAGTTIALYGLAG